MQKTFFGFVLQDVEDALQLSLLSRVPFNSFSDTAFDVCASLDIEA